MKKLVYLLTVALIASATPTLAAPTPPPQAKGVLKTPDGTEIGNVIFTQYPDGTVFVSAAVKGLPQGTHGLTVREKGVCTPDANAAGAAIPTDIPPLNVTGPIVELSAPTRTLTVAGGTPALIDADGSAVVITANGDENAKAACAVLAGVPVPAPAAEATGATGAAAEFKTLAGETVGNVTMSQNADGSVRVQVQVRGMPAGTRAMHVHQFGACAPTFGAAGEHHNPTSARHGVNNPADPKPHAGDLPNITINADGTGSADITTQQFTLTPSDTTILDSDGSAVIIHANPDDERTDPGGRAGLRIACAIVRAAAPAAAQPPAQSPEPTAAPTTAPTPSAAPTTAPAPSAAPTTAPAPSSPAGGVPSQLPNTGSADTWWVVLSVLALAALASGVIVGRTARR